MDDLGKNPFDDFDNEAPESAGAVLRPGPEPSLWESFKKNFTGNFAEFENAPRQLMDARIIEKVEKRTGVAQPGDSPLAGKPSQQEYDAARARLAEAKRQQEDYEAFSSSGVSGTAAGLAGGLIGGIVSPSNVLSAGGLVAKGGATVLGRLGMSGTAARIAGVGLEAGAINAALDVPTQAMRIGAGIEEKYDPLRTVLAFGAGQALGSGMAGVAHLVQTRRMTAAQEAQAVDDYIRTRNGQMAGETAGDPPPIAPRELVIPVPTRIVPGADSEKIPAETLPRIVEAAKAGQETEGGQIRLDISPQERDALRTAGYPVTDENTVPPAVIADLARNEAVQTQTPATGRQNETTPPTDIAGQTTPRAGENATPGPEVRPAGDAGQPGTITEVNPASGALQVDRGDGTVGSPGIRAVTADDADSIKKQWRGSTPYTDEGAMLRAAPANQQAYATVAEQIGREVGAEFKNPGVKTLHPDEIAKLPEAERAKKQAGLERFQQKARTLNAPGAVTDLVRGGYDVKTPQQSDEILRRLAQKFEIIDEGWYVNPQGYFDRKAYVRFPDGMIGEVQFWPPGMLEAKEKRGGHALYEQWRSMPEGPEAKAIEEKMISLYGRVAADLPPDWSAAISQSGIGGNSSSPNLRLNSGSESTRVSLIQEGSGLPQESPRNTRAAPVTQTIGSPSNEPNFQSAIARTSTGNIRAGEPQGNNLRASQAGELSQLIGQAVPSIPPHRVATASGRSIDVAPVVVEAASLRTSADAGYDPALQPRNRDRAASQAQILDIATRLDPERLGQSAEADRGAPIVGPDGMVESGNGRILAIRQAYQQGGEAAGRYRQWLQEQGVAVAGFREPVIVRQRLTDLTAGDRQAFTVEANQAATLSMSAGERAMADARNLRPETLDLIRNADDLDALQNREFVQAFVRALPQSEQGMMTTAKGGLSSEGLGRVRNAVLAKAYGDANLLTRVAEATTDDIKSISNALTSAAPEWAKFRADVDAGTVRADMDLTRELMEAVSRTADIRAKGTKLDQFLAQQDAFDRLSAPVESWMRMFYNGTGKRAAGAPAIAERLKFYAREARKVSSDDGLGFDLPPVRAQDIQVLAATKAADDATAKAQTNLFERGRSGNGAGGEARGPEAEGRQPGESGQGDGGQGARGNQGRQRQSDLAPQPLLAKRTSGPPVAPDPDSRFPQRQTLPGEGGARTLPANATQEEIASFRVTEQHRSIADRLGLKLETDGRFTLKGGVLGEYKPKEGVLRIRFDGDTSVFNHELGHAIDQRLRRGAATRTDMHSAIYRNAAELRALDSNTNVPSQQSEIEGVAEFIRMYLDQPAYARKQAPNFADEFDRLIVKDPELKSVMDDAYRATQIDSGMEPMQRMSSMIAPAEEPTGLRRFNEERKRLGIPSTLALNFDRFYANIVGKDRYVDRFVRLLDDAHFEKTGQPLPRRFEADPYKMFRMLPGAKQAAIDGIYNGVRDYGRALEGPKSASLRDALSVALDGNLARMDNVDDPVVKDFNAYLVARRSRNLYDRWETGDLRNPPVRASKNEVLQSITDFETRYPQFVDAANKVFSYANAMWKKKWEAGLISTEVYSTVAAKGGEYVPFFRDMQDNTAGGPGGGAGGAGQAQSVVKALKGSTRDILDPIRSLMYDAAQTERIIHVNDTFRSVVKLAESGGEFSGRYVERIPNSQLKAVSIDMAEAMKNAAKQAGLDPASADGIIRSMESLVGDDLSATVFRASEITPSGERIFFVWENGERAAYKVGNDQWSKNFFETVSSMNAVERDIMLAMFGKANAMFSQFITNAPQFAIKNLIMDNMSRIFVARDTGILGRVPGASIATGIYTQLFDREFAKSYAALGGIRGGVASAAQRDLQNQQAGKVIAMSPRTLKEWTMEAQSLITDPKRFAVEVAKSPWHAIQLVVKGIEATETMGRLGQAKLVQRHLEAQGVPKADAAFGAVYEARDILDYDRRGFATVGATRFMPFMNVGIQGISHANEVLTGAPLRAAIQAYQRGGYDKLDANMKAVLSDAVRNWGMIAAAATMTYSYAMYMSDDPTYQAQSEYMRRRYFIFPAGMDETGRQKIVTIPKPFDTPGAVLSAVEGFTYSQRRADGKSWERAAKAMEEAAIPRQFGGLQEFLGANPVLKTGFEYVSGMKIGFDGGPSFPIVPQTLRSLPPDMQYQATTSWFAKQLGDKMGWSPMVSDHVMNGLGGTTIRDANYALTAAFGDNPNITNKDAMNRVFFGALYRDAPGGGQFRSDLMKLMATDNGKYSQAARGYQRALEIGDSEEADRIYANGNETAKTLMTLRGSEKFKPADRQLHPLERTYAIGQIIGKVATDMSNQELELLGGARRRTKKGQERNIIEIDPAAARSISNTLQSLMAEETRNGLKLAGEDGYQTYDLIDTKARYEAIRKLSPEVADELQARIKAAHILPPEQVQRRWPEVKRRLLQDKNAARIGDLRVSP